MNTQPSRMFNRPLFFLTCLGLAAILGSCSSSTTTTPAPTPTLTTYYTQTNLVADASTTATAAHYDPLLLNPWGIAFSTSAGAHPWMSANSSNASTFYDTTGGSASSITIPLPNGMAGGAPSGIVYNGTSTNFGGNHFIFSTEDGTLAGWAGGPAATIVSDSSGSFAVYKGLAIDPASAQLYASDFHNNTIVVFDANFKVVNTFTDKTLPAGYGPFGIQNIGGVLYVTYARQDYVAHDDSAGAGIGFVDRFSLAGVMLGRFTSNGDLNSPWGIAQAPSTWTGGAANAILIGNFGDGKITAYDQNGNLLGQLGGSSGYTISIPGLWAISFNPSTGADPNKLYFTAGPGGESHGIFGYLYP